MKLPFSTDPKFWVMQSASFILGLMLIFSISSKRVIREVVNILTSLPIPQEWEIGCMIFGILCLIYTIGGK